MAKNSIRDYDATSANNTDVQSVDISEGCAASGINNAIREVMADLKNVSTGAVNLETPAADQLDVDNIRIDGNTISSTDTNGNLTIDPNGTGKVVVPAAIEATTSTHANASVFKSTGNTQIMLQDTDASANDQFWGLQVSGGDFNILTCNDDRASGFVTPLTIAQAGNTTITGASTTTYDATAVGGQATAGTLKIQNTDNSADVFAAIDFNTNNDRVVNRIVSGHGNTTSDGFLAFVTENSGTPAEAMRINNEGHVGIGDSTPVSVLEVRKNSASNGRVATFGSNGTASTDVVSGLANAITIGRSYINVPANTTTNLVSGYGGSLVLLTILQASGVADVQRTVLVSHAWSSASVLFENNYGGNSPTITFSASSSNLRVNHNHSGALNFNVQALIIPGPSTGG